MILKGKKVVIMGVRNKWSIAWGAAKSAYEQGAEVICTCAEENIEKVKPIYIKGKLSFYLSIEKEEFDSFLTENMKKEIHELGYDNFIDLVKTL